MAEEMKADGAGEASAEETSVPAVQETGVKPLPPEDADTPQDDDGSMSLIAHLTELRSRLIKCLLAVAVGSAVGYYFIGDIMHYLTLPVGKLYYMQPAEAFFTYIKIAVVVGFLLALPVIFYHVWRFFLPALTPSERMVLAIVVPVSVVLFFLGLAFSFFLVCLASMNSRHSFPSIGILSSSSCSSCRSALSLSCRSSLRFLGNWALSRQNS